eukprot:3642843-Rhodomonas_salina.1
MNQGGRGETLELEMEAVDKFKASKGDLPLKEPSSEVGLGVGDKLFVFRRGETRLKTVRIETIEFLLRPDDNSDILRVP